MRVQVHIVNAFIDKDIGGNPAGVVVDANALSSDQKLKVAQSVGLSETAFVSSSTVATVKLEFFTPARQIAHCGHATIATFSLLRQLGMLNEGHHTKETLDGNRDIIIESDMAFMEQRAPSYRHLEKGSRAYEKVLRSLCLSDEQLIPGCTPCVVNTGNSFLVVPIDLERVLSDLRPDFDGIQTVSEQFDLIGYYPFSLQTKLPGRVAGARMFAPRYGITEEAATGMAAGPLACFLYETVGIKKQTMLIEQGRLMQPASPSVITVHLRLKDGSIEGLMAGGRAKSMRTMAVEV